MNTKQNPSPSPLADEPQVSARQVLARFASYYKPYTFLFVFDLVCATVLAAVDLAFPQFLNFFTKDFFLSSPEVIVSSLGWITLLFVALYALRTGCQYFITSWGHIMGARMEADMRRDLFGQYQRLSFSYYDRNNTGEMMSKLLTDLFDISELAHHGPENLFICILKIVGSFALLFLINVPLTAIMLGATVLLAAYAFWRNYKKRVIFTENRKKMADINARLQDSLGGIRVVKSFGNEGVEIKKFARTNERFVATKESSYRFMGSFHAVNSAFTGVLYTVTIVGGGYFVAQGTLAVTDLAIYALYIGIFLSPIEQLINFTEQFQKGYAGFRRFMEVLAVRPDIADAPDAVDLNAAERARRREERHAGAADGAAVVFSGASADAEGFVAGAVRYRDVHFSYDGEHEVLRGLDLAIPAGTNVALVGPSGGGKTTTCSLLPRFYDPASGSVEIDGIDIRTVTVESLRDAIGIVQQDVYLFGGTIRENIAYGRPEATTPEIVEAARRASIHDFVLSLPDGYDTFVGERGARLSGGQKQRIAIARVFLKDPRILILDEATSALDNESERAIQKSLEELSAGRTTLVIAHRLSTIRNADLIAVVEDGRVAEQGTHDELLALGGTYANYYKMQFGGVSS
ncbi:MULTISPECIES: ABC transporter ATP-binding protein [Gordonibacter]|uniref:ABC transporter ATP-binding protein n=1 Tax=Gordonibacter faecis TaxID=3047475 RepID=A0ABT7DQJ5_9ACTN|nr:MULTISPECIES: ABC transporter ATP-binding protein [unclassified Gordonibacter]MDJ1651682.1 ABC transporter ATP-binding protein [Gordonibacter sp. KGMB12511]HIW77105.1 ABC transporter ATP-binding protein/permease [Candidatus Gordonibacter avicola]